MSCLTEEVLHEKWGRKLGGLAFQQSASVCNLSLFLCLKWPLHKIDTGILWPHWCNIPKNMCSWDVPALFPAACAWVAVTLMTEWREVILLDLYLLCCVFGPLCLHLEPFNGHLNVPDCTAAGALLQWGHRVISSVHVLCTLRTGSWQRCCVDKQLWNQQISANETLFSPLCAAVMASSFLIASSFLVSRNCIKLYMKRLT